VKKARYVYFVALHYKYVADRGTRGAQRNDVVSLQISA